MASSALSAAETLRTNFERSNASRRAAGRPTLRFGPSLHVGTVLYGNIGTETRLDFTVVGLAVNEASRIQDLCRPLGQKLLISEAFKALLADPPEVMTSVGTHPQCGVKAPVEVFTLGDT